MVKKPGNPIDWSAIEKDFRFGSMSNVALGEWYGVSESAIRKRAKQGGWIRGEAARCEIEPARTPATPETTSPEAIIGRGRNLTLRLLDELDATTSRLGELREIVDAVLDVGDTKAREAVERALSLKERSDVLKSLALTAKTLAEAGAPSGVKARRQAKADSAAQGGGKFAPPSAPKMVVDNTR